MRSFWVGFGGGSEVRAESAAIGWRKTDSCIELQQAQSRFQHRSASGISPGMAELRLG